ncbi:hypothetical protein FRC04_008090 [Tulasnella sp. 424]|nr:hypothetical protein FRC04_008090 [Tulasnella sp. 424]KAG8974747.1 hypothetical protein FRC05_006907 [Tulasnella sp. 425]
MAEAVFESLHPLDSYFIESLDDAFCVNMPGATAEMIPEQPSVDQDTERQDRVPWRPAARWGFQAVAALLEYVSVTDTPAIQFAEQFKYFIISSSLLDTSLAPKSALPTVSRFPSPLNSPLPAHRGPRATNLDAALLANARPTSPSLHLNTEPSTPLPPPVEPSTAVVTTDTRHPDRTHPYLRYLLASPTIRRNAPILAVTFALALNGYVLFAFVSLFTLKITRTKELEAQAAARNLSYASTLDAVQSLINANNVWGAVVGDAMSILEHEEKQLFYGPVPSNSPSTSIRVALASTLHSTQSQSDTVRQLFVPLTSSTQLVRLSEMYSPPSPTLPKAALLSPSPGHSRPASMYGSSTVSKRSSVIGSPSSRKAELSKPTDKRSTWSGATSRAALSRSNSLKGLKVEESSSPVAGPSSPRRQKKRLSTVYGDDSPPVSPQTSDQQSPVSEQHSSLMAAPRDIAPKTPQRPPKKGDTFTATPAMTLRRRRRNSSLSGGRPSPIPASQPLSLRPASASSAEVRTPEMTHSRSHNSLSGVTPLSTKLPTIQTTRHPLSLTALHSQLRNAIAAKRFTSAHLLALRFGGLEESAREELELLDGEDESYWEDVRSVVSLLTSALEDASANLAEALEEGKQEKEKDAQPSPLNIAFPGRELPILGSPFPDGMISATPSRASVVLWSRFGTSPTTGTSFAPTESHLTRFSGHVSGLLEAMDHAKLQLKECVSVVQTVVDGPSALPYADGPPPLQTALQSYDRLRKELSTALREFERGRGSLLDLIKYQNQQQASQQQHADESDGEDEDGLPALALDQSSNEADSEDRHGPLLPVHSAIYNPEHDVITSPPMVAVEDLASQHLLITADPGHLPPPHGIEQVFAYDHSKDEAGRQQGAAAFQRERSRLSREERIAMAKAKRSAAQSGSLSTIAGSITDTGGEPAWGPGGEVVQELKHVISRVEERRKLEASKRLSMLGELATSSTTPEPVLVASESRLTTVPSPPLSPVTASGQHEADPQSSGFFGVAL